MKADILNELEKKFNIPPPEMKRIIKDFNVEMKGGLAGRHSSLKMIPAYVDKPSRNERGQYLALDLGGTNVRVLQLELKGKGRIGLTKTREFTLAKDHASAGATKLFDFLAESVKDFLKPAKARGGAWRYLGFTFSFPVEQTGIASGNLVCWTKGFGVRDAIGRDVVRLLNEALERRGVRDVVVSALINDAVGTLAAGSYEDPHCDMGVIIGTGTNASYVERLSNIAKLKAPGRQTRHMIINIEWGNFNGLRLTTWDKALDEKSSNPREQILEKMVSGMYLGELSRLIFKDLVRGEMLFGGFMPRAFKTPMALKTEYVSIADEDRTGSLSKINRLLKGLGLKKSKLADRRIVKKVCAIVSRRASRISASAIAAVIIKMDPALSRRHTIAIDGSVYERHPSFSKNMKIALKEIFRNKAARIRIKLVKDGSGKGAAIMAAIASSRI